MSYICFLLKSFKIIIFFSIISSIFGISEEENGSQLRIRYNEGQKYILFPDGKGRIHIIDLTKGETINRFNVMKDIYATIYSRENYVPIVISAENKTSLIGSKAVNFTKPFKVLIHGWNDDSTGEMAVEIRDAFLEALDVNIMILDWSEGANSHYVTAVSNVPKTGEYLSNLILWFNKRGAPIDNFHLIGHSLGAHVAGIAGRLTTIGKIPYITGLDPALPLWNKFSKRIRHSDAKYVEIIHSNAGLFGIEDAIGSNDFYPNGGSFQPGCGIFGFGCAHKRAYKYFAQSLENDKFKAIQCTDLAEILGKSCANLTTLHMGGSQPKNATGIFYLETKKYSPFYLG